jgi:UDP-N-acetylmuramate dehydrogenase
MELQQNISLKAYNTFGIDMPAAYFAELNDINDLVEITALPYNKYIIGGGSNILLMQPVDGLVIHNALKGIVVELEDEQHVWLRVASGEIWHDLVLFAINNGWGEIENLALIPGTVGASPMQNIGAYGVEAKETIERVLFWNWNEKAIVSYNAADCNFGYRDSVFKQELKNKVFITEVVFKLNKRPKLNTTYGAIEQELIEMGVKELSVKTIANAVMNIRKSKLPDPKAIGNAGSFFKNPTIAKDQFNALKTSYASMPSYPVSDEVVKVPAGWLIEQSGWKGYKRGNTGVHAKQALVLVNYGNASGREIWQLSNDILLSVKEKFGIDLEREVQPMPQNP